MDEHGHPWRAYVAQVDEWLQLTPEEQETVLDAIRHAPPAPAPQTPPQ